MKKIVFFYLVFVLMLVIFTTILAEIGIRIYHLPHHRRHYVYVPDYYLGYRLSKNNKFTANSPKEHPEYSTQQFTSNLGLADKKEVSIEKPDNVYRILVMGDSFTEAFQVEIPEKFCSLLEKRLNENNNGRKYEVLNAGVRGYSPIIHYMNFKRYLAKLKPDLVIVQIFANDVAEDNHVRAKSVMEEDSLPLKLNRHFVKTIYEVDAQKSHNFLWPERLVKAHEWLLETSYIYECLWVRLMKFEKKSALNKKMRKMPQFNDGYQFFIIQEYNAQELFGDKDFLSKAWEQTEDYLLALESLVKTQGGDFLMMNIPAESQLKLENYGEQQHIFFATPPTNYLNEQLKAMADKHQIKLLDLMESFQKNSSQRLYLHWDGHLTPAGHQVLAEELYNTLELLQLR